MYIYIQWGEINIHTYENFYFLSFKHSLNKNFYTHVYINLCYN